jgi:uridine kinase
MDRQRPYPESSSQSTQHLVAALRAAPARAGAMRVLAIDGRSGAGKSTLAQALAGALQAPVVSLEQLYGGWDGLEHGIELLRTAVLEPLAAGLIAEIPQYDWYGASWAQARTLEPVAQLIVEGVGAGARSLAPYTSVLVWLESGTDVRRARALGERDEGELYAPHWARWARQEDAYIERERPRERAGFVIESGPADA